MLPLLRGEQVQSELGEQLQLHICSMRFRLTRLQYENLRGLEYCVTHASLQ